MEIREHKNGKFQVWDNNKVLRPGNLEWLDDYQSYHGFMFFGSLRQARRAIEDVLEKEDGLSVVAVHK